ncbi:aminotransferase class V-fold PLP-dependent enzyme [Kutzneria sp. 744]|uniref:aminotransferase class V-fold PLP-dependent enzyme n=1 Tax=Kutzneria sp. (strain 744) TaxID=345341 RepID=UPI0003EEAC13|nr:aminotransferase class V-fold PLP-dependent enzyme [Kutzneria sp. 744]EWM12202.1 selenocysteine lyase [Kutzneria sp. 744]
MSLAVDRLPTLADADLRVPLVTGGSVPYANLDYAASTPCLAAVRTEVDRLLPWYSSVHRGAGFASQVSTRVYERARSTVREFVGAKPDSAVLFTRNTTDALNLLGRSLPAGTQVFRFATDHHAALLSWRTARLHRLGVPASAEDSVRILARALAEAPNGPKLVVITGASNVTGELWPVAELAEVSRLFGARTVLDAAQLAAHRPIDLAGWGLCWIALSGHKMYAPFGSGALVGETDWLSDAEPYLAGGGATASVVEQAGAEAVTWSGLPHRHEGGSPNIVGAYAMAVACDAVTRLGWPAVVDHEQALTARLCEGLAMIPGVRRLRLWADDHPTVGVVSFGVAGFDQQLIATALAAEHGIGIRDGAFCAHQAVRAVLDNVGFGQSDRALRASVGLGTTAEHVDRLVLALRELVLDGPKWTYTRTGDEWRPTPDPRPVPEFLAGGR